MKSTLTKDLSFIEKAGFNHIKVELEGSLGRGAGKCYDCKGRGKAVCEKCEGKGVVGKPADERFPESTIIECSTCKGDAIAVCNGCGGNGSNRSFSDTGKCQAWLLNEVALHLTGKTFDALQKEYHEQNPKAAMKNAWQYIPGLTFAKFYNDGSVDSELTFTVPLEAVKDLPIYINAFKKLATVGGRGNIDVHGAGMHISVLPTEANGRYPFSFRMPADKLKNFTTNMSKLLPALYFVAAAGATTRGFSYRRPGISNSEKYSAVYTHSGSCFEYRVFDTCYQRPEAIFEFIGVIAKSLKFYHDPTFQVKDLKQTFSFGEGRNIAGFFDSPGNLRILNAQIKYLKPDCSTFKELKTTRGVHVNIAALNRVKKQKLADIRKSYEKYKEEANRTLQRPLNQFEIRDRDYYMTEENVGVNMAEEIVRSRRTTVLSFSQYIDRNLARKSSQASVAV